MASHRPTPAAGRSGRLIAALCLLVVALTACRSGGTSSSDVRFAVNVTPSPPVANMPAQVQVDLTNASGAPITDATVKIRGDMSHAGMQPVEAAATHEQGGRYVAKAFPFTMAGDWILTVEAALPNGTKAEHKLDLKGVTGGMGDMPMASPSPGMSMPMGTPTMSMPMPSPTSAGR
ncbi:MAG: FixH family protein [Chloroflexota bacterium]